MFDDITQKVLFKYRPWDSEGHALRNLLRGELWFSSSKSFNDPFDSAITYTFDGVDTPLAEKWAMAAVGRVMPESTPEERKQLVAERLHEMRSDPSEIESMRKTGVEMNRNKFGICSLAGTKESLLMWGHYTAKHTGICVGLKVDILRERIPRLLAQNAIIELVKVDYSDSMPDVNMFQAMLDLERDDGQHIMKFVTTKFSGWKYEDEYRLIFWNHFNTVVRFGPELIEEVILGCRMDEDVQNMVITTCLKHLPSVKVYRADTASREYRLNITPVN